MKSRYDGSPGKDAAMQNTRQRRFESEHNRNDEFVKRQQNELMKYDGRAPRLKEEAMEFNAYMCNNGMHAQELAVDLTKGLDKTAYPVKPTSGNDS